MTTNLENALWKVADRIRAESSMKVNESQPYIIGFLFYKFLSEKMEKEILEASKGKVEYKNLNNDQIIYEKTKNVMIDRLGYFIEYKETFHSVLEDCQFNPENLIERLQIAFKNIEDSTLGQESSKEFNGLFSDIVLDAKVLGQNSIERSENLLSIMKELNIPELNINNMDNDVLGDTYEFLIGKFAAESGEKAGEFYTPAFVSNLLMKLVTNNVKEATYVYDPTCGSGSLLVKARNYLEKYGKLLGQEKITSTYNMARMNLFLHGVKYKDFQIENGNTLTDNKFKDLAEKIDLVVANPPFSVDWKPEELKEDPRFRDYPKMAPKSTADFAFIQHMIYMLKEGGKCGVIVPHGVLFRSNAEYEIRKYLVGFKKYLRGIIGLPANMFFNASIPTCILIFEKKTLDEPIMFIEASKEFIKAKNKNQMSNENVEKIANTFNNKKEIDKFSRLVSLKEIEENDFNLNITRYIDTFEDEEEIDINEVNKQLKEIDKELEETEKEIQKMISELVESE
ncbi:type I restriction-modification system subunit M [Metamycoplasma sualvi]|uniref:type I restriction-modification system subunit M n=1 Tax=Metamycoplasma sualvi TaxID=2125 RepID=UPI003873387D